MFVCFILSDNGKSSNVYSSDVSHEERDWAIGRELGIFSAMQDLFCVRSYKS
jgi:hypothetical protein